MESGPAATMQKSEFSVTSGDCLVDTDGCVTSPHYPSPYDKNENCEISVSAAGFLTADSFATEECSSAASSYCDKLTVAGTIYSGSSGPNNKQVDAGATVTWSSDINNQNNGWKLCYSATGMASSLHSPWATQTGITGHRRLPTARTVHSTVSLSGTECTGTR